MTLYWLSFLQGIKHCLLQTLNDNDYLNTKIALNPKRNKFPLKAKREMNEFGKGSAEQEELKHRLSKVDNNCSLRYVYMLID